ncbi:MAG TPA: limonene-1,2-epoxide hydrolase family protein [Alphaproteobacteria bacterium]|nr:limonene-1,2-epoxide hydrolase family protein [Alphaproteobacteria bacterium]
MIDWSLSRRGLMGAALPIAFGFGNSAQAAPSGAVATILAFCRAGQARDLETQMSYIPENGIYHNMPDAPIVGKPAIRELLSGYLTNSDATEIIVKNIAEAKPGLVLTERVDRFRRNGKWIDCPVMGAAEVENGKIKHWRDYYDVLFLRAQMS